jgi:hypothetical protein
VDPSNGASAARTRVAAAADAQAPSPSRPFRISMGRCKDSVSLVKSAFISIS